MLSAYAVYSSNYGFAFVWQEIKKKYIYFKIFKIIGTENNLYLICLFKD